MTYFNPSLLATIAGMPAYYWYLVAPPVTWNTVAEAFNIQSGASIVTGRYHKDSKTLRSEPNVLFQDTFLTGASHVALSQSGITFDVVSGTVTDNYKDPIFDCYGILQADGAAGSGMEIVSTSDFANGIEDCVIHLVRGLPGVTTDRTQYTPNNCYTYITLQHGRKYQYRIVLQYSRPIGLQFSADNGVSWAGAAWASSLGNLEHYLDVNNKTLRLHVHVDYSQRLLSLEIGDGHFLQHGLPVDLKGEMKKPGKVRVESKNGWLAFNYYPVRHNDVKATTAGRKVEPTRTGAAKIVLNSRFGTPDGQTYSTRLLNDGGIIRAEVTATQPDAGEGKGSKSPSVLADATVVLPAVWTDNVDGLPDFRYVQVNPIQMIEEQTWDSLNRMRFSKASVTCDNSGNVYGDLIGNVAVAIDASNGFASGRRITGMAKNPAFLSALPTQLFEMSVTDRLPLLQRAIGQEVIFDGWCIYSAVHFILEACGIHPRYHAFPTYIPPGADASAPYGPAGYDCPYYILPRGTGQNARYQYEPTMPGLSILLELVQESSAIDPLTGLPDAYYTGEDPWGNWHFEPVSYASRPSVMTYSNIETDGLATIEGAIRWIISTDSLRTDIDLQGIDAFTNELLVYHLEMQAYVRRLVGYRDPLLDRSPRYRSLDQMVYTAAGMSVPASIPELAGMFRVPFWAHVGAGDVVNVLDTTHGVSGQFVIEYMRSQVGPRDVTGVRGIQDCYSDVLVRSIYNYL